MQSLAVPSEELKVQPQTALVYMYPYWTDRPMDRPIHVPTDWFQGSPARLSSHGTTTGFQTMV